MGVIGALNEPDDTVSEPISWLTTDRLCACAQTRAFRMELHASGCTLLLTEM
jgi:hypothetical protein